MKTDTGLAAVWEYWRGDHDGGDPRALLLRADQALYQAKRAGRNRVVRYAP